MGGLHLYDVLIKNGKLIDGSGNPWFAGDLAIAGDTIAEVGNLKHKSASHVIDATALVVAPGFIDIHTHSDGPLLVDGLANSHIRQGVTTNVIGNCGTSLAPVSKAAVEHLAPQRLGDYPGMQWDWLTLREYLARLRRQRVSVNVAALVGHGTLRIVAMGFAHRPPTESELNDMKQLLREAMLEGAYGLSSGLIYTPGSYAATDEVADLARVAAQHGGTYNTHIRGENDTLLDAVKEAIYIGETAHIPVQIAHVKAMGSHMWGKSVEALAMIDDARKRGLDVTGDQYPYDASATGLGAYLPAWAHAGGVEELRKRLSDPETRAKIKHDILHGTEGWVSLHKGVGFDKTMITRCGNTEIEGLTVKEIALKWGKDEFDTAFDILLNWEGKPGRVSIVYTTICDEDIERIMRHPAIMIGSDSSAISAEGPLSKGKPHPRSFGTFVRVLGQYARDKNVLSLEQAVAKMTSLPAQRMQMYDRGLLRPGMKADVTVFDAAAVKDKATYTQPFQYPEGIVHVFVNGKHTIKDGNHLGTKSGSVLELNQ